LPQLARPLFLGSRSERAAAAISDGVMQYVSNTRDDGYGLKNLSNINYTSIVASGFMPNADFTSSLVANAFEFKGSGYKGVGTNDAKASDIIIKSAIGGAGNKFGGTLDGAIMKYLNKGNATPFISKLATENIGNTIPAVADKATTSYGADM
jgi:hypothetical protein